LAVVTSGVGCQNNPMTQGQLFNAQQQQMQLAQRTQELQDRAAALDRDNQELETLLAQSRQQARLFEDQTLAMRDQLTSATAQIARLRDDGEAAARRAESLAATIQQQTLQQQAAAGRVTRAVSSSVSRDALPTISIPGLQIRNDGDVVRIELPADRLFEPGTARISAQGTAMIDQVATEMMRVYPAQIIGVEGHTDSDPVQMGSRWANNHQLSVGRAMAVYDYLVGRNRVPANHLSIVGHGSNHPVVSNGTLAGKERNRRVELVVYPERAPGS
jgi:flagellar motor protein MotB